MADVYVGVTEHAAQLVGKSAELSALGRRVEAGVKREAAAHRQTGDYLSRIKYRVSKTGKDRVIESDHEAVAAIEWGHNVVRKGAIVGHVPGQFIFAKAFKKL